MAFFDMLQHNLAALTATAVIFGLLIGSFLNVVAHRLPVMLERQWQDQCRELLAEAPATEDKTEPFDLVTPRSRCPACGHQITALENIPLLSYLVLRGRCSDCGTHISWRYPIVELVTGLVSGFLAWHYGWGWELAGSLLFTWTLIPLSLIDFDTQLLPDNMTLPLLWAGLLFNFNGGFTSLPEAVIGAVAGYLSLCSVYHLFRLLTGKEGMGYGDFKLLAACGAWLGWKLLPVIILLSSFVGAIVGILLIVTLGRDRNIPIPFGPYIAAAGWLALLWGEDIVQGYLRFAGL